MKVFWGIFCVSFCAAGLASPQTQTTLDAGKEAMVHFISSKGRIDGVTVKRINRLGDAAASVAIEIMAGGKSGSPDQLVPLVQALAIAFDNLDAVERPSDRTPRAVLDLLHKIKDGTDDGAVKKEVDKVSQRLAAQVPAP